MHNGIKDKVQPVDAATVMGLLPARPQVLAMGEPTHREDILLQVRNGLFRQLVEREGYRTIAIESDCLRALVVDDHVTSGTGDLDDVMERGFSHEFGTCEGNRELVRWMRAYNKDKPAEEQVRFAGLDGPLEISHAESPREALTALHGYLAARLDATLLPCDAATLDRLTGAGARWTDQAVMMDPSRSAGRTSDAKELRLIADDLVALLGEQAPHLAATSTPDELDRARLYGRTATGLLRYHSWMADTSDGRLSRLLGVRDSMMAANLLALAERSPVLAFMQNSHLQRVRSTMRMWGRDGEDVTVQWWSAGAQAGTRLGEAYAFLATALGTIRHQGVGDPPPDSLEGLLYALAEDTFLVGGRELAEALGEPPTPRVSPWFGYAALDPAHLPYIDGVVFVRDLPAPPSRGSVA